MPTTKRLRSGELVEVDDEGFPTKVIEEAAKPGYQEGLKRELKDPSKHAGTVVGNLVEGARTTLPIAAGVLGSRLGYAGKVAAASGAGALTNLLQQKAAEYFPEDIPQPSTSPTSDAVTQGGMEAVMDPMLRTISGVVKATGLPKYVASKMAPFVSGGSKQMAPEIVGELDAAGKSPTAGQMTGNPILNWFERNFAGGQKAELQAAQEANTLGRFDSLRPQGLSTEDATSQIKGEWSGKLQDLSAEHRTTFQNLLDTPDEINLTNTQTIAKRIKERLGASHELREPLTKDTQRIIDGIAGSPGSVGTDVGALHSNIGQRNTLFHSTNARAVDDILTDGKIMPHTEEPSGRLDLGRKRDERVVSTSRIPNKKANDRQIFTFEIDSKGVKDQVPYDAFRYHRNRSTSNFPDEFETTTTKPISTKDVRRILIDSDAVEALRQEAEKEAKDKWQNSTVAQQEFERVKKLITKLEAKGIKLDEMSRKELDVLRAPKQGLPQKNLGPKARLDAIMDYDDQIDAALENPKLPERERRLLTELKSTFVSDVKKSQGGKIAGDFEFFSSARDQKRELFGGKTPIGKIMDSPASEYRAVSQVIEDPQTYSTAVRAARNPEQFKAATKEYFLSSMMDGASKGERFDVGRALENLKSRDSAYRTFFSSPERNQIEQTLKTLQAVQPESVEKGVVSAALGKTGLTISGNTLTALGARMSGASYVGSLASSAVAGAIFHIGGRQFTKSILMNPENAKIVAGLAKLPPASPQAQRLARILVGSLRAAEVGVSLPGGPIYGTGTFSPDGTFQPKDKFDTGITVQ